MGTYLSKRTQQALRLTSLLILSACNALAQKVGSTSMQFLKVMPSARATAVGEAYSVWASGAEALFWNPGGLATVEGHEFSLTYVDWLFDTQQGAFAYAFSLGNWGALGFQVQYVDFGIFEETTNEFPYIIDPERPGMTRRTFRPFGYLIGATYGRYLTDRFSLGLSMKYVYESLFSDRRVENVMIRPGTYDDVNTWASGVLFDFGIRYNTGFRSVQIASAVQNFGPNVRYATESYPVPLLFRVGIAANLFGPTGLLKEGYEQGRLSIAFDIFHPNDYAQQFHMGLEYEFMNLIALRGGYKFNYDADGLTLGVGLKYNIGSVRISMDYSYGEMGAYLNGVQRISLGVVVP
jgi:hypothetical protein